MGKLIDRTGQVYGRLTVIGRAEDDALRNKRWLCRCECGTEKVLPASSFVYGGTKSCGCYNIERLKELKRTHGESKTRLYGIWRDMKNRCYNPNVAKYKYYGGRGITVCDEWRESYEVFRDWALSNGYVDDLQIDRIDVNGNYESNNCRWATLVEQARNKRNNVYFEDTLLVSIAALTGVKYGALHGRLKRNSSITYEQLVRPVQKKW